MIMRVKCLRRTSHEAPRHTGRAAAVFCGMTADLHKTIVARLEDAGRTLMTLPMPARGMPAGPRTAWPEYMQKYWDVFGHADEDDNQDRREAQAHLINQVRVQASQKAVDRLDEVLGWLWYIEVSRHRRTVVARMLTHPVSERPVNSWKQIAKAMGADRRTVQRWYEGGIEQIIIGLASA